MMALFPDRARIFRWIIAALAVLGSCSKPERSASKPPTPSVSVARVVREDLANNTVLSGEFRPTQEIDLHAKVAGYLKAIHVDVGDKVRSGQLVAELEIPEMRQEVTQATAQQKRSELDAARARTEVARAETLVKIRQLSYDRLAAVAKQRPNLIAQQEIDNSLAQLQDAQALVSTAKASLAATEEQINISSSSTDRAGMMLAYTRITAPFSGVITKRYADPGALIQAGTSSASQAKPVVRLSEIDHLRLVLAVPESMVTRVKAGTPVSIRVDSIEKPILGRVSRFSNQLNSSTRTMETEVDVPNPSGTLLPGMYAYATLRLDQHLDTLSIPIQAAAGVEREQVVFVVNPSNQIESRRVRLGLDTADKYEVLSGLAEGEMVMIGSRGQLKAGDVVQPRLLPATSAKN
jgi:RND family efflux transporter MFP subunit